MIEASIKRLEYLCNTIPTLLEKIEEPAFSLRPSPTKWSKKEILGHLIDSATNNHQRFVRAQFEEIPKIVYDQDNWNEFSYYQKLDKQQLVNFWTVYNLQLAALVRNISPENLQRECITSDNEKHTLTFLFNDYVEHLEHHLRQIVTY